jgi:peptidyl-prolyl cis-trans isomerase C
MKKQHQRASQMANRKWSMVGMVPFAIFLLPLAMPLPFAQAKVLDRTVATVNDQAIMLSEFEKNATPILEQFKKASPSVEQTPERIADIKKRVLDQMIDDRLLVEEAKKKNIRVSQLEVDDGVKKVRSRFATEEEFNKELEKEGMSSDDFRKHIQEQLATIKLIDQEVKAKTPPPSDDEIKSLYDTLDAILRDKPIPGSHTPSELEELKALAKAVARRFDERVRARHILIRVAPDASKAEKDAALQKMKDIQARLKKGEDFAELAKKYSEDPGSKDHGGDLGYFSRGDMVPAFDKAAFALDVGQTSDIVTTDFGYHIIQVQEKKAASKMSLDEIKDDLRDYLFQQRGAKRFESYVKDLRAKADIKINSLD